MGAKGKTALLAEAEQLRRRWFRQLQAIEGEPNWPKGWQRLEHLRSLIKQAEAVPEEEWAAAACSRALHRVLQEADEA